MAQRHSPSYRSLLDSSVATSTERHGNAYAGFRFRFFFGLLTFLVGITGFLVVLAIAVNGG